MKITLARSAGFCFGVKRALLIALKAAQAPERVCMLGDIVHNEDVSRRLSRAGIHKLRRLARGQDRVLIIQAHGASLCLQAKAARSGYRIIDATCPMVKEIHRIARGLEKEGRTVIIIGDKSHDEVRGIVGQLKDPAVVIEREDRIPWKRIGRPRKTGIVVQSTQNLEKVLRISRKLQARLKDVKFCNTICGPTKAKQAEIRSLPLSNDVMIIIGSRTSANTRRLYEISRSLNKKSFWVRSAADLKKDWLRGARRAGVTAGASTPNETTQKVIARIKELAA